MAKIVFYDVTDQDKQDLTNLPKEHEVVVHSERLSAENVDPDTEVLSVFVCSPVPKELIEKMPKLKLIATRSTGFNHIDMAAAKKHKVTVATVPTYGEHTVAEYAIALLLALTRKLFDAAGQVDAGELNANIVHGTDLYGKTMGIVGFGRIGQNVGRLAKAFGMDVLVYDVRKNDDLAKEIGVTYMPLKDVLAKADVVSLHAPLTKDTKHIIDKETLGLMKRGSYLINTARGELVDTMALVDALQSGQLAGAAIDVIEDEKLMDMDEEELLLRKDRVPRVSLEHMVAIDILQKMYNVIITGHNAYNTVEAIGRINQTTVENITAYLKGKPQNEVA